MLVIKKEILGPYGETDEIALSYYTDCNMHAHELSDTQTSASREQLMNSYSYTVAIGSGSSYVYPRVMFIGNKQVYPPVGLTNLIGLKNFSNSTRHFTLFNSLYISRTTVSDISYIVPKAFTVRYAINMSNTYTAVQVPSFNPITQSNNSQYAYFRGSMVIIKDPALPNYKVPDGIVEYGSNYDLTYFTYFSVEANESVCNTNKTAWDTTYYPLSYTRTSNGVDVHRRQFTLGNNIRIRTVSETNTRQSTYYIFRYYYKGTEITQTNDIAKLMPEYAIRAGTGSFNYAPLTQTGEIINSTGLYPYCTFFLDNISTGSGRFTLYIPGELEQYSVLAPNAALRFTKPGSLFNFHLIKVDPNITNEQMLAFGQQSFYNNYKIVNINTEYNNELYPNYTVNTVFTNASNINTFLIDKNYLNEEHITNIPKKNSIITSIDNTNTSGQTKLAAAKINHRYANNLNANNQNQFTYITYANARTMSDVSSMTFTNNTSNGTLSINMNASTINARITTTASSALSGTYTYCYIAADIINSKYNDRSYLIVNRVLTDTYLCIKCEARTGSGTSTTNYYTEYF